MSDNNNNNNNKIFRFKFTNDIVDLLHGFAKLHQFDDRHTFKESWSRWAANNHDGLEKEERRLEELGYKGDVFDKMYKSVRYYFRKKPEQKSEPRNRRKYIGLGRGILDSMDDHIVNLKANESPADAFVAYCQHYSLDITEEASRLLNTTDLDQQDVTQKFKKTFKNRYFQIKKI